MYVTPEQIQAAGKANVEAFLAVANTQFAALEKLANIQASAMKSAFEDSIANTRALLGAKDLQEFVGLQNSFAQPALEKAIATPRASMKWQPAPMPSSPKSPSGASRSGTRTS
jgi:hypothetical protein